MIGVDGLQAAREAIADREEGRGLLLAEEEEADPDQVAEPHVRVGAEGLAGRVLQHPVERRGLAAGRLVVRSEGDGPPRRIAK